jgi:hypothetical protein
MDCLRRGNAGDTQFSESRSCLVCFGSLTASRAGRQTHRFRVHVATLKRARNSLPPWLFQNLMRLTFVTMEDRKVRIHDRRGRAGELRLPDLPPDG